MALTSELPSFERPPLHEVALAVQWDPIPELKAAHLGLLWQRYRNRFPNVLHRGELPPMAERLGLANTSGPSVSFGDEAPGPRLWFLNDDGSELIQVQSDRFIRNWRKASSEEVYPRYANHIRPAFKSDIGEFQTFLESEKLGPWTPNQCEVLYVNQVKQCDLWNDHSDIAEIFNNVIRFPPLSKNTAPEQAGFNMSYQLRDDDNEFVGRLHITCSPIFSSGSEDPIYVLNLVARGQPLGEGLNGAMSFLDFGRSQIVHAFKSLTSEKAHKRWGLK